MKWQISIKLTVQGVHEEITRDGGNVDYGLGKRIPKKNDKNKT